MDINEIKTVTDLINQNNTVTPEEQVIESITKAIYEQDPAVGQKIVIEVLTSLLGFHDMVITEYIKEGNADGASTWAIDMARIDTAITLLKGIQL